MKYTEYQAQVSSSSHKVQRRTDRGGVVTVVDGLRSMRLAERVAGALIDAQHEFARQNGLEDNPHKITLEEYGRVFCDDVHVGYAHLTDAVWMLQNLNFQELSLSQMAAIVGFFKGR